MNLLEKFHDVLESNNLKTSCCLFCGERVFTQLAHIIPSGHTKNSTSVKQVMKNNTHIETKALAIKLLDLPLLNIIPSCPECNGLGNTNIAQRKKFINNCSDIMIQSALEILESEKNIMAIVQVKFFVRQLNECIDIEDEVKVRNIKELQRLFQLFLIGEHY